MLQLDQNLSFVRVSHEDAVSVADLNVTADDVGSEVAPGCCGTFGTFGTAGGCCGTFGTYGCAGGAGITQL